MLVARLAAKDLLFSLPLSLCLIAAVAAIVAPLLMMVALRVGVVDNLRARLLSDPHILEVSIRGNWRLERDWFDEMSSRQDVAFVIPLTRSLSAQVDLVKSPTEFARRAEIVPTRKGDPLLARYGVREVEHDDEVILAHETAKRLAADPGDAIEAVVSRQVNEQTEYARARLLVIDVAPEAVMGKNAVFTSLMFLEQVERYLDLEPAPMFDGAAEFERKSRFARARLYATEIEMVGPLADVVRSGGIEAVTRADDIESVLAIDRVSGFVVSVVAWVTGVGGAAAMVGFIVMNVDRRRQELAILRLVGFTRIAVISFPMTQSLIIGILGLVVSFSLHSFGENIFNSVLGASLPEDGFISKLPFDIAALASALVVSVSVLSAGIGGLLAARIEPAEALRQV